nr:hypothetical protein [Tanacetum cinerariifolium]
AREEPQSSSRSEVISLERSRKRKTKTRKSQLAAKGNNKGKGKSKLAYAPKPNIPPPSKKEDPSKDSGFRRSRKLKPGALSLYMGNGQHATVEAIGSYDLCFPSGLVLVLHNYHYAASITRRVILVSRLYDDGFINRFENGNSILHCRLGHISNKRIKKLQHNGLLNSIDSKSFEKCVPCLSGKMARKPYSHQVERDKDLLGLIHTDVCGPFRIVSRQRSRYFVTFTNDFSRHGYVYLLKHKHEVFLTFKVFQKEVENQIGKTIKSLCSDRGGEYMSQEFLDHLKEHGIISHRTPPYTPQHNRVSKRRNRTLLDMVCSMMSQTNLLKSFWDYAFESVACILNMVITKKVEKTPYEADEYELGDLNEPANYKAALSDPEFDKWLNAMNVEMQSTKDNEVWDLVDLTPNGKTVDSKWLFKKKTDMDGVVHTYKACLITKGFTQTSWIDYEETFSPIADIRVIRIIIAIAAFYDYEIRQMDVKTAFLNEYLSKEGVKSYHGRCFAMKDFGEVAYIFGIKIYKDRSKRLIGLCQSVYIKKILKRYYMENSKRVIPYALTMGSLMYDVRCTRPDVALAQNITSRFQQNPGELHWTAVNNILKYLRNTKDIFLAFGGDIKQELRVSCYIDVGYLTDADDLKSQTAYVLVLNGSAVDWKSTKQSIFATSSTKTEYIAVSNAFKEAVWVRKFIVRLGTIEEPKKIYCDNTRAIMLNKDILIPISKTQNQIPKYTNTNRIPKKPQGFPAQSVGSSSTKVLDSPCLLVLITGTSQSRQHESCKSPTKSLFDVGSSRISIFIVNTFVSLGCSGKFSRKMRRTLY